MNGIIEEYNKVYHLIEKVLCRTMDCRSKYI